MAAMTRRHVRALWTIAMLALVYFAAVGRASADMIEKTGTFGDFGVWSLDARKVITTGDGGMLYVRDAETARRARRLAYHGLEDRSSFTTAARSPHLWWSFDIEDVGRRLIGNDITADGTDLIVITGANGGGKTTFLRSVGVAHLMMHSGMFVTARSLTASITAALSAASARVSPTMGEINVAIFS